MIWVSILEMIRELFNKMMKINRYCNNSNSSKLGLLKLLLVILIKDNILNSKEGLVKGFYNHSNKFNHINNSYNNNNFSQEEQEVKKMDIFNNNNNKYLNHYHLIIIILMQSNNIKTHIILMINNNKYNF